MSAHMETTHTHGGNHEAGHEHGGPAVYARTLAALVVLTAITVGAAYVNLGAGNVVVALFIATIKASLVVLFFMHLRWDKPVYGIVAMAGFIFLGVFMGFCLMDQESRNYYLPQNVHRTEIPLSPGTAPPSLTAILPEPADATTQAAPAAPGEKGPAAEKK